ncbi:MAG: hypothetical protein R2712_12995 [Vicinamibacterales bacterium]
MRTTLLDLLRCPFCGGRLNLLDNAALVRATDRIESGVIWCDCCAFPVVAGIPVLKADDTCREAIRALEAGHHDRARAVLLGLDDDGRRALEGLLSAPDGATYRAAIDILSPDPEGTYFVYRFSDPTFLMAEAILRVLAGAPGAFTGRVLDLCGGSGHLTRVLTSCLPGREVVLADVYFWKLWLARTFTAPAALPICCDANEPLPLERGTCPTVVLSDAFPYIWHKRLLADEMLRQAGPAGTIVMPHLHSARGENVSAGMTLPPEGYEALFAPLGPRLFSDRRLLDQVLAGAGLDLGTSDTPGGLGDEPSLTLIASGDPDIFRRSPLPALPPPAGVLAVNPLYAIEPTDAGVALTLRFPTDEYAEEFAESRRYLADRVEIPGLRGPRIPADAAIPGLDDLRRRRIVLDVPDRYC